MGNLAGSVNAFFEQMKTLTNPDIVKTIEERNGGGDRKVSLS